MTISELIPQQTPAIALRRPRRSGTSAAARTHAMLPSITPTRPAGAQNRKPRMPQTSAALAIPLRKSWGGPHGADGVLLIHRPFRIRLLCGSLRRRALRQRLDLAEPVVRILRILPPRLHRALARIRCPAPLP